LAYKEAAARLGISPHTVRSHAVSLLRKLEAKSQAQAVFRFYAAQGDRPGEAVAVPGLAAGP